MDVSKGLTFHEARKKISNTLREILSSAAIPDADGLLYPKIKHIFCQALLAVVLYVIAIALASSSLRAEALAAVVAIVILVTVDAGIMFMYHKSEAVEVHSGLRLILTAYDTYCGEELAGAGRASTSTGDLTYLTSGHSQVSIVHTYRDGRWQRIPILLLAEGDIIALMGGDITPGQCCEIERVSLLSIPPPNSANIMSPTADHRAETRWQLGRAMQAGEKVLIRNKRYFSQQSPARVFQDAERSAAEAEPGANEGADQSGDDGHTQPLHDHHPVECQLHDEDAEHMVMAHPSAHSPPHHCREAREPSHPDLDYGNRHRTLGAESVEILSLSGDVRCFRMTETPVAAFVRRVVLNQAGPDSVGAGVSTAGLHDTQRRDYAVLNSQSPGQAAQSTSLIRKLFQTLVAETGLRVMLLVTLATAAGMAARYVATHFRDGSGGVADRAGWADHVLVPSATACVFFLPLALPLGLVLAEACATADVLASAEVTLGHTSLCRDPRPVGGTNAQGSRVSGGDVGHHNVRNQRAVSSTSDDLARASSSGVGGGAEEKEEEESLSDQFVDEDLDDRAEDIAEEVHTQVTWRRYLAYLRRVLWHRLLLHWYYSTEVKAGASRDASAALQETGDSFYLPVPLARSRLLEVLGAVTMVCFVDDDVICEGYSVTEEIFLLMDDHQSNQAAAGAAGKAGNQGHPVPPGLEDVTEGAKGAGATQSRSNVKGVVLDLHANPEATGSRFENPQWWRYLPSLKPLGLNALLTYTYGAAAATLSNSTPDPPMDRVHASHADHHSTGGGGLVRAEGRLVRSGREALSPQAQALSQSMYVFSASAEPQTQDHTQPASVAHSRHSPRFRGSVTGSSPSHSPHHHHHHHHHSHGHNQQEQHQQQQQQQQQQQHTDRSLVRHIRHLLPQEALRELAEEIGFEQADLTAFSRVLEVNVLAPGLENAHLLEDTHQWGQEESRRRGSLLPQLRGGVYRDFRDGSLQMMCLGDPSLVLNYCREYWDGSTRSITPLSSGDRAEVLQVYERWRLEDFEVVAFCYSPLPTASLNPLVSPKDDPSIPLQAPSVGMTRRGSASMSADQVGRSSFSFSAKQQPAAGSPLGCVPFTASKHSTLFFVDPITTAELQRVAAGIAGKARHATQSKAGHRSAGQTQSALVPEEAGASMARSSTVPAALPSGSNTGDAGGGECPDLAEDQIGGGSLIRAATIDPKCLQRAGLPEAVRERVADSDADGKAPRMSQDQGDAAQGQGSPEMSRHVRDEEPQIRATSRSDAANTALGSPARPRGASNGNLVKSVSLDDVPQYSREAGSLGADLSAVRLDGLYGADTTVSSPGIAPVEDIPSPIRVSTSAKDFRESKHLLPRLSRRVLVPHAEPSPHLSFPDDDETATVTSDISPSVSETPTDMVRPNGAGIADMQLLDGASSDDGRSLTPPPKPMKRSVSQSGMGVQPPILSFDDSIVGRSESKLFTGVRATPPPLPRVRITEQRRSGGENHGRAVSPSLRKHTLEFVHPFFVPTRFAEQRQLTARQRLQQEQQRVQQHARQLRRASTRQLWSLMRQQVFLGMAASSVPVRRDVPNIKEDLDSAGVRFVYFSAQNMKRSKPVAEKIGIPFDWNCAISLRELDDATGHDPHRHISNYADWDVLARMPHGIEAIKRHLETVDNVPLLVSLFTDATPMSVKQMVEVFRDNGEVVLAIGGGYRSYNQSIYSTADLGCSVSVLPGLSNLNLLPADEDDVVRQFPVRSATSLCRADILLSFRLIGLNTTNFLQTPCLSSVCRKQGITSGSVAPSERLMGEEREEGPQHSADPEHLRLGVLTETLRKGRILLLNMLQALAFYCIATLSLGLWPLASLAVPMSLPPSPTPGVALLFVCVHVPVLCFALLQCGEPEGVMKHAPRKNGLQQRPRDLQRFLSYLAVRCACVLFSVALVGWVAAASTMRSSRSLLSSMGRFHFLDLDSAADRSALWLVRDIMSAQAVLSLVAQACTLTVRGQSRLAQFPWPWRFPEGLFYIAAAAVVAIHTGVLALRSALREGGAFGHSYASLDWPVWLLMAVLPLAGVLVGVLSNRDDERHHKRYLQFLRLEFDTRLGMHSPR